VERDLVGDGQHVPSAADPAAGREHLLLLGERPLLGGHLEPARQKGTDFGFGDLFAPAHRCYPCTE
jgi:hypothetical protein